MPELPEVETVMLGLQPALEGRKFIFVEARRKDLRIAFPKGFAKRLTGRRIARLWRRAKYIMVEIDGGETLVIHLGMSGRMSVFAEGKPRKIGSYVYDTAPATAGQAKQDRKSTRLNSSHLKLSRMPSSA